MLSAFIAGVVTVVFLTAFIACGKYSNSSEDIRSASHPVDAIRLPEDPLTVELLKSLEHDTWIISDEHVYFSLAADYRLCISSFGMVSKRGACGQNHVFITVLSAADHALLAEKVRQLLDKDNKRIFGEFNRKLLTEFRTAVAAANN